MRYSFRIIIFALPLLVSSQVNLLYFNSEIPQAGYLNPAHYPSCKLIIGIPLINGIGFQVAHSGFTYNQLFINEGNTIIPDPQNALNKIGRRNYLQMIAEISDFYIGYKYKKIYFNFAIRERIRTNIFYNNDLIRLGLEGNAVFKNDWALLKGTAIRLDYFRQYSLGASYQVYDYLNVGAHLNILFGKANMFTNFANTGLYTDSLTYALTVKSDAYLDASAPYQIVYDENGNLQYEDSGQSPLEFLMNGRNKGISIDLGFIYENEELITIYGSILDLGLIRYTTNTTNYTVDGVYTFNGLPDTPEGQFLDQNYAYELVNEMDDSINTELTNDKYTSLLPVRTYLGAQKPIYKNINVGVLIGNTYFRNHIQTYVGLHTDYQLGKHINTMINWSFAHRSFKNLGIGFSFDFLPINFYIVTDNIVGMIWPRSTKNINVQFGFNLKFGCKNKVRKDNTQCIWMKEEKSYRKLIE